MRERSSGDPKRARDQHENRTLYQQCEIHAYSHENKYTTKQTQFGKEIQKGVERGFRRERDRVKE